MLFDRINPICHYAIITLHQITKYIWLKTTGYWEKIQITFRRFITMYNLKTLKYLKQISIILPSLGRSDDRNPSANTTLSYMIRLY